MPCHYHRHYQRLSGVITTAEYPREGPYAISSADFSTGHSERSNYDRMPGSKPEDHYATTASKFIEGVPEQPQYDRMPNSH